MSKKSNESELAGTDPAVEKLPFMADIELSVHLGAKFSFEPLFAQGVYNMLPSPLVTAVVGLARKRGVSVDRMVGTLLESALRAAGGWSPTNDAWTRGALAQLAEQKNRRLAAESAREAFDYGRAAQVRRARYDDVLKNFGRIAVKSANEIAELITAGAGAGLTAVQVCEAASLDPQHPAVRLGLSLAAAAAPVSGVVGESPVRQADSAPSVVDAARECAEAVTAARQG